MRHINVKVVVLAAAGSAIVSMSAIYTALRMGALPWPTIFSALVSFAILRKFGSSLNEVNVAHTGMSAGGLVAGGIAFTLPAVWMIGSDLNLKSVVYFGLVGVVLGVGLVLSMRERYIVRANLPFPMGLAAAQTLKAGDEGGRKAKILFSWMGISALFTFLRDGLKVVPVIWKNFGLFPMAVGVGFIIGTLYTLSWFLGWVSSVIASKFVALDLIKKFGVGMLAGGGLGMALRGFRKDLSFGGKLDVAVLVIAFFMSFIFGLDPLSGAMFIALSYVAVLVAGVVTGTTGIDPMEVFSMLVLMVLRLFFDISGKDAVLIALSVAVATGLSGDSLQDMKAGYILKTDPRSQALSELIGAVVGVLVSAVLVFTLKEAYGSFGPGTYFPAPQAFAVSQVVKGGMVSKIFVFGFICGVVLQILKLPALTFGIGMYLPTFITLPVALGGAIRLLFDLKFKDKVEDGIVASSGIMGGEGIVGVLVGIFMAMGKG